MPDAASASGPRSVDHPIRAFINLWRWYRPNLTGQRLRVMGTLSLTLVYLVLEAALPLVTGWLLLQGSWNSAGVAALMALVIGSLALSLWMSKNAGEIANASATVLRERVFAALFSSRAIRQEGMARSSVVSRHTSDVDRVAEAVETSLESGLPGVVRVLQSLVLLTIVDLPTGITMTAATALFLVVHHVAGRRMLRDDHLRHDANSHLSELVDETITSASSISGLGLAGWQGQRFAEASGVLEQTSNAQVQSMNGLRIGARFAGLLGLAVVVAFALLAGSAKASQIAASLMFINAVVTGLTALPLWVRSLQVAVVSRQRIDQVLNDAVAAPAPVFGAANDSPRLNASSGGLQLEDVSCVAGVGLALDHVTLSLPQQAWWHSCCPPGRHRRRCSRCCPGIPHPTPA